MRRRPQRLAGADQIEQTTNDSAGERRRVDIRGVLREERGGGDAVDQHADFEVWLDDGHFDVERGDLVGERLCIVCKLRAALTGKMDARRRSLRGPSLRRSTCLGLAYLGGRLGDSH